jgi:hypothetical protein
VQAGRQAARHAADTDTHTLDGSLDFGCCAHYRVVVGSLGTCHASHVAHRRRPHKQPPSDAREKRSGSQSSPLLPSQLCLSNACETLAWFSIVAQANRVLCLDGSLHAAPARILVFSHAWRLVGAVDRSPPISRGRSMVRRRIAPLIRPPSSNGEPRRPIYALACPQ